MNNFMLTSIIIFLISFHFSLGHKKSVNTCTREKCKGNYKIQVPKRTSDITAMSDTKIIIHTYPDREDVLNYRRYRLRIICDPDVPLFEDQNCKEEIIDEAPNTTDIRNWNLKKLCLTGHHCLPYGTCTGKKIQKCYSNEMVFNVGPIELQHKGERWDKWFQSTCIQSWSCILKKYSLPTYLKISRDNTAKRYFVIDNNFEIEVNNKTFEEGAKGEFDYRYTTVSPPREPSIREGTAKCFSSSSSNIKCVTGDLEIDKHVSISVNNELKGVLGRHFIEVVGPIKTIINGTIMNVNRGDTSKNPGKLDIQDSEIYKASSIEDIKMLAITLYTLQLQDLYNLQLLENKIIDIENIQIKIIESLSTIMPKLLSKIIGDNLFETHWINDEIFLLCPCKQIKAPPDSNCDGSYFYGPRSVWLKEEDSPCQIINSSLSKTVNLYEDLKVEGLILQNLKFREANIDNDAYIAMEKAKVKESIVSPHEENVGAGNSSTIWDFESIIDSSYFKVSLFALSIFNFVAFVRLLCVPPTRI